MQAGEPALPNTARSRATRSGGPRPSKRLIICEDGTWLNSDGGSLEAGLSIPSNVTRIARAIKARSSDGIPQIVYYHFGIGAAGGIANMIYGGATGEGLAENIREAVDFISTNYVFGDEIFLFGFSRGAYTARSIAGFIGEVGVLTKEGLPYLAEIFRDVQHQHDPHYRPKHPNLPFPDKPSANDPKYKAGLLRLGLTRPSVSIRLIGVWDTVGSLGLPKLGWLERLGIQTSTMKEMSFYDTSLSNCIENAFQALALDERRFSFQPAVWEKLEGNTTTLRQVWFPGVHSNIGGGFDDQQIANITLAWMMAQCEPFLDMDLDYVLDQADDTNDFYKRKGKSIRPWSFGKIYKSVTGFYALGGSTTRSPGRYFVINPDNGKQTDEPLQETHEYIHASVRSRFKLGGPGINDEGRYESKALQDWKLMVEAPQEVGHKMPNIYWKLRTKERNVSTRILPEAPLKGLELDLLDMDPETYEYVVSPSAVRQKRVKSRSQLGSRAVSRRGERGE